MLITLSTFCLECIIYLSYLFLNVHTVVVLATPQIGSSVFKVPAQKVKGRCMKGPSQQHAYETCLLRSVIMVTCLMCQWCEDVADGLHLSLLMKWQLSEN